MVIEMRVRSIWVKLCGMINVRVMGAEVKMTRRCQWFIAKRDAAVSQEYMVICTGHVR